MSLRIWKPVLAANFSSRSRLKISLALLLTLSFTAAVAGQFAAHDPGVRAGTVDAGQPLAAIAQTSASSYFTDGGRALSGN